MMADVHNSENGSVESRTADSTSKFSSSSLLRPSAFAPANHVASCDSESASRISMTCNNPFAAASRLYSSSHSPDVSSSDRLSTPSKFLLRPSALDKQTSSWCKDTAGTTPSSSASKPTLAPATFHLEPPKLVSPFPGTRTSSLALTSSVNAAGISTDHNKIANEQEVESKTCDTSRPSKDDATLTTDSNTGIGIASASVVIETGSTSVKDSSSQFDSLETGSSSCSTSASSSFVFGANLDQRSIAVPVEKSVGSSAVDSCDQPFVFGSNCADRVVNAVENSQPPAAGELVTTTTPISDTSTMASSTDATASTSHSLAESAAIVQAKYNRPELKEVEVITGEENESNVFQFNAKLHVFEKETQTWHERGRGLLRLNDMAASDNRPFQSRIVMRTHGSLRVVLNTLVWSGMLVERASPKSIQITAVDQESGAIKIFLITANPNDADLMFGAIASRAQQLRSAENKHKTTAVVAAATCGTDSSTGESQQQDICDSGASLGSSTAGRQSSDAMITTPTSSTTTKSQKRPCDPDSVSSSAEKRQKLDSDQRRYAVGGVTAGDESNDSSALDPETEASNEGFPSSPTIQSSSSSEA